MDRWYSELDRTDLLALLDKADNANPGVLALVWRQVQEQRRYMEIEEQVRYRMAHDLARTYHCDRCGPTIRPPRQVRVGGKPNGRYVCRLCWPAEFRELIRAAIAAREAAPKLPCRVCGEPTPVLDGKYDSHYEPGSTYRLCKGFGQTAETPSAWTWRADRCRGTS